MNGRTRTGLLTALVLLALFGLLTTLIVLANILPLFEGPTTQAGSTRASLALTVFAVVVSGFLFAAMIAVAMSDVRRGVRLDALFLAMIAVKGFILLILAILALGALDALSHDLRAQWHLTDEPEVRMLSTLLFLGLVAALAWLLGVILRGRGWSRRATSGLFMTMVATAAIVVIAALEWPI